MDKQKKQVDLNKFTEPIEPKWRIQSVTQDKKRAIVIPYLDSRLVQQRLDDVVGPGNWQNTYDATTGTSSLGIKIDGDWVYKTDVGADSKVEKEKGKASDAFKRAAVLWGIGRNIYSIGAKVIAYSAEKKCPITSTGQPLYTPDAISLYMNGLSESMGLLMQIWKLNPDKQTDDEFKELMAALKKYL